MSDAPQTKSAALDITTKALAAVALPLALWALNLAGERAQTHLRLQHLEAAQEAHSAQLKAVEKTLESLDTTARFILRDLDALRRP